MRKKINILLLILIIAMILISCEKPNDTSWNIYKLTTNYEENPIGLELDNIRFSWQMNSDDIGASQKSYRIKVFKDNLNGKLMWDSKNVKSGVSVAIPYQGYELEYETKYFWSVEVTNQNNRKNTETSSFETGSSFNGSNWITIDNFTYGTNSLLFRTEKELKKEEIKSARLYITSLGVYDAYINGKLVQGEVDSMMAPGWTDYSSYIHYQTYDVIDYLNANKVTLGVVVGSGWYGSSLVDPTAVGYRDVIGKKGEGAPLERSLFAKMVVTYEDNSKTEIFTNNQDWKATNISPYIRDGVWEGELYDATIASELGAWNESGYDVSSWKSVELLTYEGDVISSSNGIIYDYEILSLKSAMIYDETNIINLGNPYKKGELDIDNVKKFNDGDKIKLSPNETLIVDFGQNASARVSFKVNAPKGTTITINTAEIISDGLDGEYPKGIPVSPGATKNLNTNIPNPNYYEGYRFQYVASGEDLENYQARFHFVGYQYLVIQTDHEITFDDISSITVSSLTKELSQIETSHELINQFIKNSKWSQLSNYASIPMDCPHREYYGWSGDAQIFVESGMYHYDAARFIENYIHIMDDYYQSYDGYGNIMPKHTSSTTLNSGWSDAGIIIPYAYWQYTGDKSLILKYWNSMTDYVDRQEPTGLDISLGDWKGVPGEGANTDYVRRIFYIHINGLMSEMAKAIGNDSLAIMYRENAEEGIYQALESNRMGIAQTALAWSLKLGIYKDEDHRKELADILAKSVRNENQSISQNREENTLSVGFLGVNVLLPALSENGYADVAYDLMMSTNMYSFLYSVSKGSNTMWEQWDMWTEDRGYLVDDTSYNHYSYGAASEWVYEYMVGIQKDSNNPGFKHFILQPQIDSSVTYVEGSYDSYYGKIVSNWKSVNGKLQSYVVAVPANTTATLYLPLDELLLINELKGVKFIKKVVHNGQNVLMFELLSGSYKFEINNEKIVINYT